jgi:putative phosphotransacetylase
MENTLLADALVTPETGNAFALGSGSEPMGCSPFCQECGACASRGKPSSQNTNIDMIVDEVVKSITGTAQDNASSSVEHYPKIPLGISNRHIHLREDAFKVLFGADAQPRVYRQLYQPGEFALAQTCIIVGPKMRPIHDVRILGPFRKYNQVEISFTDSVALGINPPVRDSGDLHGAAAITIVGPAGSLVLKEGAIIANRHLHATAKDAAALGIAQGDLVKIKLPGVKSTTYENVLVRTNDSWKLQLHLDTDDANAAHVVCNQDALLIGK